ncbi:MAG: hypothetical protein KDC71_20675 [Acidobacteria bacterium]|nr:hypothetical protein [Acidobacteriota bacterium]
MMRLGFSFVWSLVCFAGIDLETYPKPVLEQGKAQNIGSIVFKLSGFDYEFVSPDQTYCIRIHLSGSSRLSETLVDWGTKNNPINLPIWGLEPGDATHLPADSLQLIRWVKDEPAFYILVNHPLTLANNVLPTQERPLIFFIGDLDPALDLNLSAQLSNLPEGPVDRLGQTRKIELVADPGYEDEIHYDPISSLLDREEVILPSRYFDISRGDASSGYFLGASLLAYVDQTPEVVAHITPQDSWFKTELWVYLAASSERQILFRTDNPDTKGRDILIDLQPGSQKLDISKFGQFQPSFLRIADPDVSVQTCIFSGNAQGCGSTYALDGALDFVLDEKPGFLGMPIVNLANKDLPVSLAFFSPNGALNSQAEVVVPATTKANLLLNSLLPSEPVAFIRVTGEKAGLSLWQGSWPGNQDGWLNSALALTASAQTENGTYLFIADPFGSFQHELLVSNPSDEPISLFINNNKSDQIFEVAPGFSRLNLPAGDGLGWQLSSDGEFNCAVKRVDQVDWQTPNSLETHSYSYQAQADSVIRLVNPFNSPREIYWSRDYLAAERFTLGPASKLDLQLEKGEQGRFTSAEPIFVVPGSQVFGHGKPAPTVLNH